MIESSLWIVTDIDGTLMDHAYDLSPAKKTIKWLQDLNIPVIPCTSKTASEVELIRSELNLKDPYIVENGGAIYGEDPEGARWEIVLGEKYEVLVNVLKELSSLVQYDLRPLNDLTDKEAYELTGLSGESLIRMRERYWSMPFLNPPNEIEAKLADLCKNFNVNIFRGNRMSHLLSINSNKGKAIQKLREQSQKSNVYIIGLGDSPNDLPLIENSDCKIVIPGENGPNKLLIDKLINTDFILAEEPHGLGWRSEVMNQVSKYMTSNNLDN